jgi:hypothetical protein
VAALVNRRLVRMVALAAAPGVLVNVAWVVWLTLPWAAGTIGTVIVVLLGTLCAITPYVLLLCAALMVGAYMRGPVIRITSLAWMVAAALLLDWGSAYVALESRSMWGGAAVIFALFLTPLTERLVLVLWSLVWGLAVGVTALVGSGLRPPGPRAGRIQTADTSR